MKLPARTKYFLSSFFLKSLTGVSGYACYAAGMTLLKLGKRPRGMDLALRSIRYSYSASATRLLKENMGDADDIFFASLGHQSTLEEAATRTIILSTPMLTEGHIRKGVILITFTTTFAFYLRHPQFNLINKYFVFVLEPSWAGYAVPEILLFLNRAEHCLVQSSEERDRALLNALFPKGIAASFGASDWVNPDVFSPDDAEKCYDSIYVANLNPIKRAYRYIDAIAAVKQRIPQYKACLVCAGWGGDADDLKAHIASRNLNDCILFIPGLERKQLVKTVNMSKTNVLLSFKEGSNRSLFEAMFSNVPVICVAENIGVNKSYINEFTGLLVPDSFLEDALEAMYAGWNGYQPRNWAMSNIAPEKTTDKLSQLLKTKFGGICNAQIATKSNDPEVTYLNHHTSNTDINLNFFKTLDTGDEQKLIDHLTRLSLPYSE